MKDYQLYFMNHPYFMCPLVCFGYELNHNHIDNPVQLIKGIENDLERFEETYLKQLIGLKQWESPDEKKWNNLQDLWNNHCEEYYLETKYPNDYFIQFALMQYRSLWLRIPTEFYRFNIDYYFDEFQPSSNWLKEQIIISDLFENSEIEKFKPITFKDDNFYFAIGKGEIDKLKKADYLPLVQTDLTDLD